MYAERARATRGFTFSMFYEKFTSKRLRDVEMRGEFSDTLKLAMIENAVGILIFFLNWNFSKVFKFHVVLKRKIFRRRGESLV